MESYITNVSFLSTKKPKCFKLSNPKEIMNCEGPKLILYMEFDGSHRDLYLYASCDDSFDYIYIKVDQEVLLNYLRGYLSLQEVLFSCPKTTFYYEMRKDNLPIVFELPIAMLSNYRIKYSENRINDIPNGVPSNNINQIIECFENWIKIDPYGEEKWANEFNNIIQICIDFSLYFRFKHC